MAEARAETTSGEVGGGVCGGDSEVPLRPPPPPHSPTPPLTATEVVSAYSTATAHAMANRIRYLTAVLCQSQLSKPALLTAFTQTASPALTPGTVARVAVTLISRCCV